MLSQSLPPHEVIVVDDGSTDHSIQTIRHFGSRVTLVQQPNKGPGAARNAGLGIASGDFIQFMDSDDFASRNKIAAQVKALVRHNADIVYGPLMPVWKKGNVIRPENVVLQQAQLPPSHSPLYWFLTGWSMMFQQCLVRRALLQYVGGYHEGLSSFEDGDLFVKLLVAGGKLIYEPDTLTFYRLDDFGKLTASGQELSGRIKDEAWFYENILASAENYPVLQPIIRNSNFKRRVWNVLLDIKHNGVADTGQYSRLHRMTGNYDLINHVQRWLARKRGGMQQLLKGHRWADYYRAGNLNDHQITLISELGWQLT